MVKSSILWEVPGVVSQKVKTLQGNPTLKKNFCCSNILLWIRKYVPFPSSFGLKIAVTRGPTE
jgi:hypothetical protein